MTDATPFASRHNPSSRTRHAASFSIRNKLFRVAFRLSWLVLARFTPPPLHAWRCALLRLFGARIGTNVRIYGSCDIWSPRNLDIGQGALIGPSVRCYNQGRITIGADTVVSQHATLCASTHDVNDPAFPLILRPIVIGASVWIATEAFVGPGVNIGEGAVLGARGVAMRDLAGWSFYTGNPATVLKPRARRDHAMPAVPVRP